MISGNVLQLTCLLSDGNCSHDPDRNPAVMQRSWAQEEIRGLHEKEKDLQQKIKGLEREIAAHKREIKYRDDTIGEKEKKIYELKKKNQEASQGEQGSQRFRHYGQRVDTSIFVTCRNQSDSLCTLASWRNSSLF